MNDSRRFLRRKKERLPGLWFDNICHGHFNLLRVVHLAFHFRVFGQREPKAAKCRSHLTFPRQASPVAAQDDMNATRHQPLFALKLHVGNLKRAQGTHCLTLDIRHWKPQRSPEHEFLPGCRKRTSSKTSMQQVIL